jgi:hypothetical protein
MQHLRGLLRPALLVVVLSFFAANANAVIVVDAKSAPWLVSLNPLLSFGDSGALGPTIVSNVDQPFVAGDHLLINGSNFVSAFPPAYPLVDASGAVVQPGNDPNAYAGPVNDSTGSSGNFFPSKYMGPYPPDVNLMELVGTFADSQGTVVGTPFFIGLSRVVTVPAGATRLQLGVNDDVFGDNGGAFEVTITNVPEPRTVLLMLSGLGMLLLGANRRNRHVV